MSRLKTIREANSYTQVELSAVSGVSVRMIQNYEQGTKDINKAQANTLYKLATFLNCSIEDLLEIERI